ncbi:MAG: ribulose-phosphate 3-epimerase [Bacilli bacterium]
MKISVSILETKTKEDIQKLDKLNLDYLHLDIMDGEFVDNKTWNIKEIKSLVESTKTPLDVHLMVNDVYRYIDEYSSLNPTFITFHYEATKDHLNIIKYIKSKSIKVGMSIKPETEIKEISEYLKYIDLLLIMSVEPGRGGQKLIPNSIKKIADAKRIRNDLIIEVDGGINDSNIKELKDCDIAVIGSFITNGDYKIQIDKIKNV